MDSILVGQKLQTIAQTSPELKGRFEAWVVNTTKVKLLEKYAHLMEQEGKDNLRKLLLVPLVEIKEFVQRIEESAPELRTLFYRELTDALSNLESQI